MGNSNVFIDIMKENWLHARHVETERMWFVNIFAAITVGTIVYLSKMGLEVFPLIVLLLFSLFCLWVTIKLNAEFGNHMKAIENIFEDGKIPVGKQTEWRKYMGMPLSAMGGKWRILRVGIAFISFYGVVIIALVSFIIWVWLN